MIEYYNSKIFIEWCRLNAKKEIIIISKKKYNKKSDYSSIINNNTFCSKF